MLDRANTMKLRTAAQSAIDTSIVITLQIKKKTFFKTSSLLAYDQNLKHYDVFKLFFLLLLLIF